MAGPPGQGQARRPGQDPGGVDRGNPGLFDVSEGEETDEEDEEGAHFRVPHIVIASNARHH